MNEQETRQLLEQLRGVHLPEVSALPAMGWWLLALVVVLSLAIFLLTVRRHRANRWHRQAMHELALIKQGLEMGHGASDALVSLSKLLRRVMMHVKSREEVASLCGAEWMNLVNNIGPKPTYTQAQTKILELGPYQRDPKVEQQEMLIIVNSTERLFSQLPAFVAK